MRLRPAIATAAAACVAALALSACSEDVGYVEIKIVPGYVVPPLVLGAARIDTTRGNSTVLREKVGPATLAYERDGERVAFCQVDVRKDRIVTVSVSAFGRDPRCKVQG